jgi:hypothetical protein
LKRLLDEHNGCADTISDAEIEGAYEMVTEHLFPYSATEMEQIISLIEARKNSEEGASYEAHQAHFLFISNYARYLADN